MLDLDIVFLWVGGKCHESMPTPSYYLPYQERFIDSWLKYRPSYGCRFHVVFCGKVPSVSECGLLSKLEFKAHTYLGGGKDIGAYQKVCKELRGELAVYFASVAYLWKPGGIERLVDAYKKYGNGAYAPMASYENSPHLRTGCFACPPKLLAEYPIQVNTLNDCVLFESCKGGFTDFVTNKGLPVKMVTWDQELDRPDWRKPDNIFRRGDQSNCPIKDRHVDIYDHSSPEGKQHLAKLADGLA